MSKKSSQGVVKYSRVTFIGYLKFFNHLSKNTVKGYIHSIRRYTKCHGMNMMELVEEALDEQTNQVPNHLLKVIDRIEDFQDSLINEGLKYNTIQLNVGKILTIYHKNRVNVPYIEPLNSKSVKRNPIIEFKDILTKEELRQVIPLLRLPIRARVMAMVQGGLSNEECEHLTTRAFIDELKPYHQKEDDVEALEWLRDETHPVIWVTKLIRVKTGKPYYALIGAEAVNTIAEAKLYELGLPKNKGVIPQKLLNCNKLSVNRSLAKLNKSFGLGMAGGMRRLRPHSLRKFHATYISGSALSYDEHSIITNAEIDEMQGRGKTGVQDTYIKTNPLRQKTLYAKVMNNVSLWHEYDYQIIDGDVQVYLIDPSIENQKLKKQVESLSKKLQKKKQASEKVDALRNELGEDTFRELIGEILNAS